MTVAHDVYSETNPALCAFVLAAFVDSYAVTKGRGPDLATAYVALPIALSGDLGSSFEEQTRRPGSPCGCNGGPRCRSASPTG